MEKKKKTARPFMVLAKASLGLNPVLSDFGNPLKEDYITVSPEHRAGGNYLAKVECLLQLIMGLQNDILGIYHPTYPAVK